MKFHQTVKAGTHMRFYSTCPLFNSCLGKMRRLRQTDPARRQVLFLVRGENLSQAVPLSANQTLVGQTTKRLQGRPPKPEVRRPGGSCLDLGSAPVQAQTEGGNAPSALRRKDGENPECLVMRRRPVLPACRLEDLARVGERRPLPKTCGPLHEEPPHLGPGMMAFMGPPHPGLTGRGA